MSKGTFFDVVAHFTDNSIVMFDRIKTNELNKHHSFNIDLRLRSSRPYLYSLLNQHNTFKGKGYSYTGCNSVKIVLSPF